MLERLNLSNFTVFADATFEFAPGLNVVVGENGSGKSHVLKAAYATLSVLARMDLGMWPATAPFTHWEAAISAKLRGVFRTGELGRLVRRGAGANPGRVEGRFQAPPAHLDFHLWDRLKQSILIEDLHLARAARRPVFLPARELLSIYPGFASLYETTELPFEETWRDACVLLGAPPLKGEKLARVRHLIEPLEQRLGGKVSFDDGRFYIKGPSGDLEAHLLAEGLRKLAMIARLIATGGLSAGATLFWDEPEANLNPKVVKLLARTILELCREGVQAFVATHSLFLMRELDILLKGEEFRDIPSRFFGLHPGADGVTVAQGPTIDDVGSIDALDEELSQSDRYLAAEAE